MHAARRADRALAVAVFIAVAAHSFALSSGTIAVTGSIAPVTEISLITTGSTTDFDLSVSASDALIGTLRERSNAKNGYKVELASLNGWKFQSPDSSIQDTVGYTLKYGIAGSESSLDLASTTVRITDTSSRTASAGVDKRLLLSYTGDFYEASADYADTLTFTITAY